MKMVDVLIESTGVKTRVSEDYYEKYKDEGISLLTPEKPKVVTPKKRAPRKKPMSKTVEV